MARCTASVQVNEGKVKQMKEEMIQQLGLIIQALNNVSVSGETNLTNLSGSIQMLKQLATVLSGVEVSAPKADES